MKSSLKLSDGILEWHLQKGQIHASSQLLAMLDRDEKDSIFSLEDWQSLIHPEDREFVHNTVQAYLLKQSENLKFKHRLRCQDEGYRVFQVKGKAHWSKDGKPTRLFLFYKSMGDRRYFDDTAEQRAEILQAVLSILPDFLIRMDGEGTYLDFLSGGNVEVYCATGRFVGESIYDILPTDIASQRMNYVHQALETGKMQTYDYEFPIDGKLYFEEARIIKTSENEVLVIVRDITERKYNERLLRESLEREQALARIVDRMRKTLEIDLISSTVVHEIRHLLQCDRVVIYQFNTDWTGQFIAESVCDRWSSLVAHSSSDQQFLNAANHPQCGVSQTVEMQSFTDTYLQETQGGRYRTGISYQRVDDIYQENFDQCYVEMLAKMEAQAYIITPIFQNEELWGLLGAYQNDGPRQWLDSEVRILVHIGAQLTIAIQQANLLSQLKQKIQQQEKTLQELKQTQLQLIQVEKMSSLGQLVSGVAHELNNPISFIAGNIQPVKTYINQLLNLLNLYQQYIPNPPQHIQAEINKNDLAFLKDDLPKALSSIENGSSRIFDTVKALRSFSRLDQDGMKRIDLHECINSTLKILQNRLSFYSNRPAIEVIKTFGDLPLIECYSAQINQVLMNLLANSIDAIEERLNGETNLDSSFVTGNIQISTTHDGKIATIQISDNGIGMSAELQQRIFDPFFTTKPVNKGTGLGLAISYQIIRHHHGKLTCTSKYGEGTTMTIQIPLLQAP